LIFEKNKKVLIKESIQGLTLLKENAIIYRVESNQDQLFIKWINKSTLSSSEKVQAIVNEDDRLKMNLGAKLRFIKGDNSFFLLSPFLRQQW